MRVFFPIEDAVVDDATGVLVPYRCGLACANELRGDLTLRDGVWSERAAPGPALPSRAVSSPLLSAESSARRPESGPACAPGPR